MIQLYYINITKGFSNDKIHDLLHYVTSETKERFHKFHFLEDSLRTLYGEILVWYISTTRFSLNTHQIFFTKNRYGKPYLDGNPLFFNISHAGDWVVGAFSSSEIGIDIEEVKHVNIDIAENIFSEYEYGTLLSLEKTKQLDYFYDIWTLKECYLKWLGTGLSTPLNSFSFHFDEKNIPLINKNNDKKLYFKQYPISKYKLSVCSENNYFPEKITEISIQDITF